MNIQERLSSRIHIGDIHEIRFYAEGDDTRKEELYALIYHEEEMMAYQALWVLTHFSRQANEWLYSRQDELIDGVLRETHPGKRRLFLNLLVKQPLPDSPRVDFLDFCFERMLSKEELPGVQSLCIKLAYNQCRAIPELLQELRAILELMEPDLLVPAIRSVRKNVLKRM
ncbi:hypothetical protein [Parabacteroides sp. PF5-6]|uniref:hypothetical protein n=1 Tax=Parabacteroides sp. PF5-6 TaxID=1742403 RepID=UPI002406F43D|nr:hypothetical protein [Parabacteroides sp. PF5-6]MDF9831579.1 hypothetical protein [Parabacteroides sp. PF5-6]